jgi:hypothetical protein
MESPESSSPIVTRAVAAGLLGEYTETYEFPGWQKVALAAIGVLPEGAARLVISRFESLSGLPAASMDQFSLEDILRARLGDYDRLSGPFPAVTVGAALGGATSYLSLALHAPFLPQTFVVTLKGGSMLGDVNEFLQRSLSTALRIAEQNPGLMTIQHYDPMHDGWMTRYVNFIRFKLLDLPESYRQFLHRMLVPGGAVVLLEGGAQWLRYRVGPRSTFQVGGWGGIPAQEFLAGSRRVIDYAHRCGLKFTDWKLDGYPLEEGPESEWGSEPGLEAALEAFCTAEGYRFLRIPLPHPNDFSRLAFASARSLLEKQGQEPAGVLVEMFSQFDSTAALKAGLLPLWLIFNTCDSLEYLQEMRPRFPAGKPVFFSPLATFSQPPDLTPFPDWEGVLSGLPWTNVGARKNHYPADARALVRWAEPLRKWVQKNERPIHASLSAEELLMLAGGLGTPAVLTPL